MITTLQFDIQTAEQEQKLQMVLIMSQPLVYHFRKKTAMMRMQIGLAIGQPTKWLCPFLHAIGSVPKHGLNSLKHPYYKNFTTR